MAREQTKEITPIMQAFAEGKTIQDWTNNTWKDKEYTSFGELSQSPIKPQPKVQTLQKPRRIAMVVKHSKTGNLYQLIDDECKSKINGKWVDAVIYHGKDKETGDMNNFVREKSDFDSHFTTVIEDPDWDDIKMAYNINVLKEVATEYPGKTIENIITQLEARSKELNKSK